MNRQPLLCLLLGQLVCLLVLLKDSTNTGKVTASYSRRQKWRLYLKFDLDFGVASLSAVSLLVTYVIIDTWRVRGGSYAPNVVQVG
jgi:hypothetical protein